MANIHTPIPALKLNDGSSIPMLGYGVGTAWGKKDEGSIDQAIIDGVKTAIKLGYTHLDGAESYKNETELGRAIKESGVDRSKLYVTTKAWEPSGGNLEETLKTSLKKLQLDYVDLYLIHSPFWAKSDQELQGAWAEMEKLQEAGLAKTIGVSNYRPQDLEAILKTAKVYPAVNQIEFHPYLQRVELLEFHKKHGIATAAYGPLSAVTKAAPGPVDDIMAGLTKKYAVSAGEISLRWCIDQDCLPITTSAKEQRLSDYLRATTFKLTPAEIKQINEAGQQKHYRGFWGKKFEPESRL